MSINLPVDIHSIKGFLAAHEGEALYHLAAEASGFGACLEVGSYCGKSTIYMASACKLMNGVLYAVDHHRGSEEHQPGEEYHDPSLFDQGAQLMDSFRTFRGNIRAANLENWVVPIVASSAVAARFWNTPLSLVFIDGGHSLEAAMTDYRSWSRHIVPGGYLAIHDIFPDPNDGGQAPYEIYKLALASAQFELVELVDTLGILRRV
ncbi:MULTISPECIES: class I SAM-dependent methyltransferase [Microbulbifer]|uniref:class I SAM-dependent methyltransferase n=1 Tax=Microbulbifer TaxID=48073 RepID=UPI001E2CCECB|nr:MULTISPECIES: class I SAM-dependent methyltransferase [Microbulbifer]UHQ55278.1 class I SAM-dependent methyltransferase [Microbulbifer sp. YPW16]